MRLVLRLVEIVGRIRAALDSGDYDFANGSRTVASHEFSRATVWLEQSPAAENGCSRPYGVMLHLWPADLDFSVRFGRWAFVVYGKRRA